MKFMNSKRQIYTENADYFAEFPSLDTSVGTYLISYEERERVYFYQYKFRQTPIAFFYERVVKLREIVIMSSKTTAEQ